MMTIEIPGGSRLELEHLVLDYNGTVAEDGAPLPGVAERVGELAESLAVHVITADTHGDVAGRLADWPVSLERIGRDNQDRAKERFINRLGAVGCVAVGNGRNDGLMLSRAVLGIAVLQAEGVAGPTLAAADVVTRDIRDALDLLTRPLRLKATLRS